MYLGIFCFIGFPEWPGGRGGGGAGRIGTVRPGGFIGRLQNRNINVETSAADDAVLPEVFRIVLIVNAGLYTVHTCWYLMTG